MEPAAARPTAPDPAARACPSTRPYLPQRPKASPLHRVVADHFATIERVHDERFEPAHGPLSAAARRAEFLLAFRCKGRHFCPSCHARRLAEWSAWLDEQLQAPVPHRRVRVLEDGMRAAGTHRTAWDGRDANGREARPGIYLILYAQEGVGNVSAILVRMK